MIELDNVQYTVKTPAENTEDMLNRINDYCSNHNIVNSKNELVYIEANYASPLYLMLWAMGYLVTVVQNLVYGLGKAFNVQSASEKQLLNLAAMAGLKRGTPSLTTFDLFVRAADPELDSDIYNDSSNGGKCIITSEDIVTYNGVEYAPALYPEVVLEPGQTAYITMVAKQLGSYSIEAGSIQQFDEPIDNLAVFKQSTSIPGQDQESVTSLRERLQRRKYSGSSIDAAMDAIRALPGVTTCNIYYNPQLMATMSIGEDNIQLTPRTSLCIVQGYNQNIAQTFYEHLFCPTISKENIGIAYDRRLLEVQTYVSHANQTLELQILKPALDAITVQVHIAQSVEGSIETAMKQKVCELAQGLTIGQTVTSAMVLNILKDDFSSYGILGVQLMGGRTQNLTFRAIPYDDAIFTFNVNNVTIVMPEADEL